MLRGFLIAVILVAAAYALAFFVWVSLLPAAGAGAPKADGIVALTGSGPRLEAAVALLEKGVGKRLLISGVDKATLRDTLKDLAHGGARFDCCADIGYAAEDTRGNAAEAADWAHGHDFHSLVVVTARYHMPRALVEFRAAMPEVALLPWPVEQEGVNLSGWWRHPNTIKLLHREFAKYLASRITQDAAMIFLRSALFMAWFLGLTLVMGILFLPLLALPRQATVTMARGWAGASLWGLKVFAGIGFAVKGRRPEGGVLVASKHMSMWDTLALYLVLDDPGIVLKRELLRIPFYGWYLSKAAAIAIDRGAGAEALRGMTRRAMAAIAEGRPILIFPEGTRKAPGAAPDYKPGVAGLYTILKKPCVPVALDSGRYWQGFWKYPGIITLEFLEPIAPGLGRADFMSLLENRIESATQSLLAGAP